MKTTPDHPHLLICTAIWIMSLTAVLDLASLRSSAQCVQTTNVTGSITYPAFETPYSFAQLVWDDAGGVVVDYDNDSGLLYTYDGAAWLKVIAIGSKQAPPQRNGAAFVYDEVRHTLLLFGGYISIGVTPTADLFSADLGNDWQLLTPAAPVPPVCNAALGCFDAGRGRAVFLLNAAPDAHVWQTWEWTGSAWEQGPSLTGADPDNLCYDRRRNVIFAAGGDPATPDPPYYELEGAWVYTPAATAAQSTWSKITITNNVNHAKTGAPLIYDSYRDRILRICGFEPGPPELAFYSSVDTWNWDSSKWITTDATDDLPDDAQRASAGAAYDLKRDTLVIYGGIYNYLINGTTITTGHRFDTWEQTRSNPGIVSSSKGSTEHCVGDAAVFSITGTGPDLNYQWFHAGLPITNATSQLLVINNLQTSDAGNYVGRVYNDCGYMDTSIIRMRVDLPITIFRQALFPNCSETCIGRNITINPPLPVYTGVDLNTHLQKNIGSALVPVWVDVRVDTPSAPANFIFTNVDKSFTGPYRFYIDGSACPGIVASVTNYIQVGFEIVSQPQSLANIKPCDTVTFSVGTIGGCSLTYQWYANGSILLDDGHFIGTHTPTLTINGVHYDDEGNYFCYVSDPGQCQEYLWTTEASLKLTLPQWVLRTTNGPSPRYGNAVAYDSGRGVTVMYSGGFNDPNFGYTGYGDLWEWDGARWRQRTTYNWTNAWHQDNNGYWVQNYTDTPAARMQHAMAYDSQRRRVVMFGGHSSNGHEYGIYAFNDTWEWDGTRWYFRTTNGPPATFNHRMAYDPIRGVTVLYGGFGNNAALVWEWDGNAWRAVSPTNGPPANTEQDPRLDFDTRLGTVFAGPTTDDFYAIFFWTWDGHDWHSRASGFEGYSAPTYGEMAYDTYRYRSFHFGGLDQAIGFTGSSTSAYYDSSSDTWTLLADAAQTSAFGTTDFFNVSVLAGKLAEQADPVSRYLWNQFDTTTQQVLTNSSSTFDQLKNTLAAALNNIINHNSVYDSNRFAAVILSTETQVFNAVNPQHKDLVRFNRLLLEDAYPTDIVRSPSTPPGRYYFGMDFDSARRAAVVMGGYYNGPGLNPLNGSDTWELMYLDTPLINDQPASQYRAAGDTAVFAVNAVAPYGSTLNYQWYFGAVPLNNGGRISGTSSSTLRIANVNPGDAGQYQARVSAACGTIYTVPAILTTDPRLQIFSAQQGAAQLVWSAANLVLQQADSVAGPWTTVAGATSPFDLSLQGPGKFFRLNTNSPAGP